MTAKKGCNVPIVLYCLILLSTPFLQAKEQIETIFNSPPNSDHSILNPNETIDDTVCNFLNRALPGDMVYIAAYNISGTKIKTAFMDTVTRIGKNAVFLIYEKSNTANFMEVLGPGKIENFKDDGTTDSAKLMHNKFIVIKDKAVLTGSYNFTVNAAYNDNNNIVIITSREVARLYEMEFKNMYDTGIFGATKSTSTHNPWWNGCSVDVGGALVDVWFSPYSIPGQTNTEIKAELKSAIQEVNFAVYTIGLNTGIDNELINLKNNSVAVNGILEKSQVMASYDNMKSAGVNVIEDLNPGLMHHKYAVIDPGLSTAKVITGSHNWTTTANNCNDENLVVIKSEYIAGRYASEFNSMMKTFNAQHTDRRDCGQVIREIKVYPSPAEKYVKINFIIDISPSKAVLNVYSAGGRRVYTRNITAEIIGNSFNEYIWYLGDTTGTRVPPGLYTLEIVVQSTDEKCTVIRKKVGIKSI
ncbi:MAG: phospholipase D-like domain-containing protein [Elusimicrobiota bacterium]